MSARVLAIGDIHGCDVALEVLVHKLNIRAADTLIVLGDAVDRGPGTKRVVEQLIELEDACRLIFIQGNHEEMMLDGLKGGRFEDIWLNNGGQEAIDSYGRSYADVLPEHVEFLKTAIDYWENETAIFTHASLEPDVPLNEQSPEWLRWTRFTGEEAPHSSGKRVLCGHTPRISGEVTLANGWVCLDTWAYHDGYLSCLDLTHGLLYQSQQTGEFFERGVLSEEE